MFLNMAIVTLTTVISGTFMFPAGCFVSKSQEHIVITCNHVVVSQTMLEPLPAHNKGEK